MLKIIESVVTVTTLLLTFTIVQNSHLVVFLKIQPCVKIAPHCKGIHKL